LVIVDEDAAELCWAALENGEELDIELVIKFLLQDG
jgi:hypothetical protein